MTDEEKRIEDWYMVMEKNGWDRIVSPPEYTYLRREIAAYMESHQLVPESSSTLMNNVRKKMKGDHFITSIFFRRRNAADFCLVNIIFEDNHKLLDLTHHMVITDFTFLTYMRWYNAYYQKWRKDHGFS